MKRKYFIGAMATLLLGACSQDEVMSVRQDGINYSVTTPSLTRAADSYCNEDLETSSANKTAIGWTKTASAIGPRKARWTSMPK